MRLSVEKSDPGYSPHTSRCKVFLAGAERSNVLTADEERRYAKVIRLDVDGRPVVKGGEIQTEDFYGDVRIELSPYASGGFAPFTPFADFEA